MWRKQTFLAKLTMTLIIFQGTLGATGCSGRGPESKTSSRSSVCYDRPYLKKLLPMKEIVQLPELVSLNGKRERFLKDGKYTISDDFSVERGSYLYGKDYIYLTVDERKYRYRFCEVGQVIYLTTDDLSGFKQRYPIKLRSIK